MWEKSDASLRNEILSIWLENIPKKNIEEAILNLSLLGLQWYLETIRETSGGLLRLDRLQDAAKSVFAQLMEVGKKRFERGSVNRNQNLRRSRPDSLAHFPFVDEVGHVDMILNPTRQKDLGPSYRFVSMGKPARIRLVQSVYQELKAGQKGIRLSDVPEALGRLGITVSKKLRKSLQSAGSHANEGVHYDEAERLFIPEVYVDELRWMQIVKKFYHLMKKGVEPSLVKTLDFKNNEHTFSANLSEDGTFSDLADPIDVAEREEKRRSSHPAEKSNVSRARNSSRRLDNGRPNVLSNQTKQYYSRLREVPSRLGEVIRRDKDRFARQSVVTNKTATAAIASHRIAALTGTGISHPPDSWRPIPSHQLSAGTRTYRAMTKLDSGAAAMGIADAFLNGTMGRELLGTRSTPPDSGGTRQRPVQEPTGGGDDDDDSLDTSSDTRESDEASRPFSLLHQQQKASALMGLPAPQPLSISPSAASSTQASPAPDNAKEAPPPGTWQSVYHRVIDVEDRHQSSDSQRIVASGWRSAPGGWVADFGAPHTHSLLGLGESKSSGSSKYYLESSTGEEDRLQREPLRTISPRDRRNGVKSRLVEDLRAMEASMGEVVERQGEKSQFFYSSEEESIDTAAAGAGEGDLHPPTTTRYSFDNSISLRAVASQSQDNLF